MDIPKLEQRIRRQPEWKQRLIRATVAAVPHVQNEHDREILLPAQIANLLGPEKTINGSTVYAAVEKIKMILDGESSSKAAEARRLATEALKM